MSEQQYTRADFAARLGANGDPKLNAAAEFTARLLNSSVGDRVAQIVLFGSVAWGDAHDESDVDLLVIGTNELANLDEHANEIQYDMLLNGDAYISPMVYGVGEASHPSSWFLYNSLKVGKEIYRMNENDLRNSEAQAWWILANDYLAQAEDTGKRENYRLAVDGAYNAAELAVKGLLAFRVERMPTSHGGLVQIFGREYIISGAVDRKIGAELRAGLRLWGKARYDREAEITAEDVVRVRNLARKLIDLLGATLSDLEYQGDESD